MGKDKQEQAAGTQSTKSTSCLSLHPLVTAGGWYKGPRFSRLQEDRMIFTSSLAAFAHLWGMCPPWVSHSTRGNRTGWGVAEVPDGPSSTQGSSQRQPDPSPLLQGQQAHEGVGPMLDLGWTGRVGAQRLNKPQSPTASRVMVWLQSCLWAFLFQQAGLLFSFLPWVFSFLPCLQVLIETTSLQAKISLARGNYSFNPPMDYSFPCSASPASQWRFPLGKGTFQDWWVLMRL